MSTNVIDDFKLLEFVQQNVHLYDKNNPHYRDILKKTITWKAIGAALGASGELCRKRFRCLRDRFNKERKVRQEEMLSDPALPAVYKKMLFLWDHLTHRRLVPVATRLLMPNDDESKNAEDEALNEEIEKQIQMLKKENAEESKMENSSNEEAEDSNSQNVVMDSSVEFPVENNQIEEQKSAANSMAESEDSCIKPVQIMFVKSVKKSSEESFENDNIVSPDDNRNLINGEDKKCDEPAATPKKNKDSPVKNSGLQHNKRVTKRKFLQSNLRRILPKRKVTEPPKKLIVLERILPELPKKSFALGTNLPEPPKSVSEHGWNLPDSLKKCNSNERNIVPSSRISCNEAFCAVVKSYLDKITNPERLSAARLQIMTTLHNELYSTYS